jgi:hypothetical protein
VLVFFEPEEDLDETRLLEIIAKHDIRPKSNIKEFDYYDEQVFRNIENKLLDYLNSAGIQSLYS